VEAEATLDLTGDVTTASGKDVGIGGAVVAGNQINVIVPAGDLYGLYVDRVTTPATPQYAYGINATLNTSAVSTSNATETYGGTGGAVYQYKNTAGIHTLYSYGMWGNVFDYGHWVNGATTKRHNRGLNFAVFYQGTHSAMTTPQVENRGINVSAGMTPVLNVPVVPPIWGLVSTNYGAYITATTNPSGTGVERLTGENYGIYVQALGTTEGTQTN